jgi:hypothetical protein
MRVTSVVHQITMQSSPKLCTFHFILPLPYFAFDQGLYSCPAPVPAFHQLPSKPNVPNPAPVLRTTPQDSLLDYSLVGMSGANIFHEMMRRHNVKHMFGIPGGAILPVFDAIHDSNQLDFVLSRHEQGAGHMAEGYARASGKPGVVLVTSGPGVTNVVTPMQDALSDGVPMVVFCGQVPTSSIGKDAFQEVDIISISRSCTKWNVMVKQIMLEIADSEEHPGTESGPPAAEIRVHLAMGQTRSRDTSQTIPQ